MGNGEKCRDEAKALEQRLIAEGRNRDAQIVMRLRKVAAGTSGTLKTVHKDNMELRRQLALKE